MDHPRKDSEDRERESRSSALRKRKPLLWTLAMSILVATVAAFIVGVGGRMIYELFKLGWDLFGY